MTPLYIVYHFQPHGCYSARNANHGTRKSHAPRSNCRNTLIFKSLYLRFTTTDFHTRKQVLFALKTRLVCIKKKPCLQSKEALFENRRFPIRFFNTFPWKKSLFEKKLQINLHISHIVCTFAPLLQSNGM